MSDLKVVRDGVLVTMKDMGDGTYSEVTTLGGSLAKLVKIIDNVSVPANGWVNSAFIDFSGLNKVGLTVKFDASISMSVGLSYSHDGISSDGSTAFLSASNPTFSLDASVLLPFIGASVKNGDAALPHVLNAYLYGRG